MLRCFSTLGCPELTLDQILSLAAQSRIDAVELRSVAGTVDLLSYFSAQFASPEALRDRLRRQPVQLLALDLSWQLAGGSVADRDALVALLPWAEAAGVRWLRVFDAHKPAEESAAIAEAADSVRWWRELRRERGIRCDLMVETHDILFTAATIRRFLHAAPGTAILWDTHHTWKKGGEDPIKTWPAIRDAVVHVHVKDSISVPSARHAWTYVLPGDGEFPIQPIRKALQADGFAGAVSLEWEKLWHPYLPPLDEAIRVAVERGWLDR